MTEKTEYGIEMSILVGSNGKRKTQALFLENNYQKEATDPAPYTLKEKDHKGKISLKRIYMEMEDPTEYMFAIAAFGSWTHWQVLKNTPFFKPYAEQWKEELEAKIMAENILNIRKDAETNATSAKWLAEKGWIPKATKGRPTKSQVESERKAAAKRLDELEEDAARIMRGS